MHERGSSGRPPGGREQRHRRGGGWPRGGRRQAARTHRPPRAPARARWERPRCPPPAASSAIAAPRPPARERRRRTRARPSGAGRTRPHDAPRTMPAPPADCPARPPADPDNVPAPVPRMPRRPAQRSQGTRPRAVAASRPPRRWSPAAPERTPGSSPAFRTVARDIHRLPVRPPPAAGSVHENRKAGQCVEVADRIADDLRRLERETADEDRQAPQERLLVRRRGGRSSRRSHSAASAGAPAASRAPSVSSGRRRSRRAQERRGRQQLDAGRGQLDRQRQPIQTVADFGHRRGALVRDGKVGPDLGSALHEEPDGSYRREALHGLGVGGIGEVQWRDRQFVLAPQPQPRPARGQTFRPAVALRRSPDERCSLEQVFEVVEHEQQPLVPQVLRQHLGERPLARLAHAEGIGNGNRDEGGLGVRSQVDEPDPVRENVA